MQQSDRSQDPSTRAPAIAEAPALSFDHIALAVRSLDRAVVLVRDLLGATFVTGGDDERLAMRSLQYKLAPGTKIELLMPLDDEGVIARFIDRHGEGFHHATLFFEDIEALIPQLESAGFEVTGTDLSRPTWRETFLRPKSGFGALFQFVDSNLDWGTPVPGITEEAVLSGKVVWKGNRPVLRGAAD